VVRVQRATTDEYEALRIAARVEACARRMVRATRNYIDIIGGFVIREMWFCVVCSVRVQRATTDECEALRIAARVEACARRMVRAT
jgi:hypothetical protein